MHITHTKVAQNNSKSYKGNQDSTLTAICNDLQQALPTPKLTNGVQYYKMKLWTYNFRVYNIKTGKTSMDV